MHFSAPSSDDTNLLSWPMHTVCIQSHMVNTVMCFGARTEAMCVFLLSFWKAMPNVLTKVPCVWNEYTRDRRSCMHV